MAETTNDLRVLLRRATARGRTRLRSQGHDLAIALSAAAARTLAAYEGVHLGEDCTFWGVPRFHRYGRSTIEIGDGCMFRSVSWANRAGVDRPCMISAIGEGATVRIGRKSGFTATVISAADEIVIGDNVRCGPNVTILDADWHGTDPSDRRGGSGRKAPVHIEDDVFLGLRVIVLKGVTIGQGSVVGAGSVVTSSIPPRCIAVGNPAKVVRTL